MVNHESAPDRKAAQCVGHRLMAAPPRPVLVQNQSTSWSIGLYSLARGEREPQAQLMMPKEVLCRCTRQSESPDGPLPLQARP